MKKAKRIVAITEIATRVHFTKNNVFAGYTNTFTERVECTNCGWDFDGERTEYFNHLNKKFYSEIVTTLCKECSGSDGEEKIK